MIERVWVEVNARVNYPIKTALISMMEDGDFSLDCDLDKYCVSWFAINTATVGAELFVSSWNEHPIPGIITTIMHLFLYYAPCYLLSY